MSNLRALAEADNAFLLEDDVAGFGTPIKFTKPNTSVAVAAVLRLSVIGVDTTVIPINTRWLAGTYYYKQNAAATIAGGVATVTVTAEIAGADSNLADGSVIDLVTPIAGVTSATVLDTTTPGADKDPDVVYDLKGQYHRIGVEIDPETGLIVAGKKSAVTVRASRFPANDLPDEGWLVESVDIIGTTVKARVAYVMPDLTAGRITAILKKG
jgi:hypothetical protein